MKFANFNWQRTEVDDTYRINIGDNLQFLAIDYLYEKMGIKSGGGSVKLSVDDVKDYSGKEYLILPMNWGIFDPNWMVGNKLSISSKIIPVYLAMTLGVEHRDEYFNEENLQYLRRFEPIGCRDETTMRLLRNYGVKAYLNGCMTAVLPIRENRDIERKKVFFIDAPAGLEKYIPDSLYEDCEFVTHQKYFSKCMNKDEIIESVKAQYKEYADKAGLIITSRLHAASPCMAMGIPVVFAKNEIDERFAWLDKLLPLYSKTDWADINWKPGRVEYEQVKRKIINFAIQRIKKTWQDYEGYADISEFWEDRKPFNYPDFRKILFYNFNEAYNWIERKWKKDRKENYCIWGLTKGTEEFINHIKENWPNAELKHVIDKYKKENFYGFKIFSPDAVEFENDEYVFVFAVGAAAEARKMIKEEKISKDKCFIIADEFLTNKL